MRLLFVLLTLSLSLFPSALAAIDLDNDGLGDELEDALAEEHLPFIYFHDEEACAGPGVLLYHVRPFAPGVDTVISISYVLLFYEDCGVVNHNGDAESFALTLYRDPSCPSGYSVHSLRTYAHLGYPFCSLTLTQTIDRCDYGSSGWDAVYVSKDSHAIYLSRDRCNDPERAFCGDACESSLVMYGGALIPPDIGQSWYMYNVGEPDHPFIEDLADVNEGEIQFAPTPIWDYRPFCGAESFDPGDYCPANIVPKLFQCSSGPSLPVEVSHLYQGPVPNPMGFCRNQFLFLGLPYGGNVVAHIYDEAGGVVDKVYLPYYCPGEDLRVPYWDGMTLYGACAAAGIYYLAVEAYRGDSHAEAGLTLLGIAGDEGRPNPPTDLVAAGNSAEVSLSWSDRSQIEEAYLVERSLGTCPYQAIAVLPANSTSHVDYPRYEGTARYRVMAHRTYGGNSAYSNEEELELRWNLNAPILRAGEAQGEHSHWFSWHFDPGGTPFDWYILYYRFKHADGDGSGEGGLPDWSAWFRLFETGELTDTTFLDTGISDDVCYEYRVAAVVNDWIDTLASSVENFHGDCEDDGCPVLFLVDGSGNERVTNLFPGIEQMPVDGNIVDVVGLSGGKVGFGKPNVFRIEEVGSDTSFIDELVLISLPKSRSHSYGVLPSARIVSFGRTVPPSKVTDAGGVDRTDLVRGADALGYRGKRGDVLIVEFPRGDGLDSLFGMVVNPHDPKKKVIGPEVYVYDDLEGQAIWRKVATLFPRQVNDVSLFVLPLRGGLTAGPVKLKLVWAGGATVDHLFLTSEHTRDQEGDVIRISNAVSGGGKAVTSLVSRADTAFASLLSGESIEARFDLDQDSPREREFYIRATGYYRKGKRYGQ